MSGVQTLPEEVLRKIISEFPKVQFAFAYGSGIVPQKGYVQTPLYDFIFAVQSAERWHLENLERHWHHYSFLRYLGPPFISEVQRRYGAHVYFNTDVPVCDGRYRVKYGVVELADLRRDLLDWRTLYVSGRLHKPVLELVSADAVTEANAVNRANAVRAALLLLPESFHEHTLWETIAGLSYQGDVRMALAENPEKVKLLVDGHHERFRAAYAPALNELSALLVQRGESDAPWIQDRSPSARTGLLAALPSHLRTIMAAVVKGQRTPDTLPLDSLVQNPSLCSRVTSQSVATIVRSSSRGQSIKGIFTAGPRTSAVYALRKVGKRFFRA